MIRMAFTALVVALMAGQAIAEGPVFVQVKKSTVRSQPNYWSSPIATVNYGDKLATAGTEGTWLKVSAKGKSGFIPSSSVTDRRVVLNSGASPSVNVDSSEVIMAGKGFNKEVESMFASTSGLDFKKVDQVERASVSDADVRAFMKAGKLGGAK